MPIKLSSWPSLVPNHFGGHLFLHYSTRSCLYSPHTHKFGEGVKKGNMWWKEYQALYQGPGSQDTTLNLITAYTREPPCFLRSPAHQVLLLSISAWPATGQQPLTWFPPLQSLLFLIGPSCSPADLSKMQIWSCHFSVGSPSINFSSPAGYTLNSVTWHTKSFQIWPCLVSSSPTQFPHLVGKHIFLFYSPNARSHSILQPLKKSAVVLGIFYSIMPWNTPCPLPEISILTAPPNLLNSSHSFKSFPLPLGYLLWDRP